MAAYYKPTEAEKKAVLEAVRANEAWSASGKKGASPEWKALPRNLQLWAAANPQGFGLTKGYTVEGIAEAQEAVGIESARQYNARLAAERAVETEKFELGSLPAVKASPSAAASLRYPSSPNITEDSDYVAFNFFKYDPPFGARSGPGVGEAGAANSEPDDPNRQGRLYNFGRSGGYTPSGTPTVILYMPEDISTGYKANWGGKAFSNFARDSLDALAGETAMDKISGVTTAMGDAFGRGIPLVGAAAIRKGIQKITGDSLSNDDIFGALSGAILNPNTELLFESTDMRNFTLNFKLVPRSSGETVQINKIIKVFKETMLPRKRVDKVFKVGTKGVQNGFISVPDLCRVSFMRNGEEHKFLPRYKMCAITQVDVNYTPDGAYATYQDGQSVAINLSISFQETKLLFAEDIEYGY